MRKMPLDIPLYVSGLHTSGTWIESTPLGINGSPCTTTEIYLHMGDGSRIMPATPPFLHPLIRARQLSLQARIPKELPGEAAQESNGSAHFLDAMATPWLILYLGGTSQFCGLQWNQYYKYLVPHWSLPCSTQIFQCQEPGFLPLKAEKLRPKKCTSLSFRENQELLEFIHQQALLAWIWEHWAKPMVPFKRPCKSRSVNQTSVFLWCQMLVLSVPG